MPDSFSIELRSLLTGLLQRDVPKRLGCRSGRGAEELKSHPFFRGIDWRVVYLQRLSPPLIPARGEVNAADAFDIGSFDEEDTKHIKLTDADQELYKNFPVVVSERWQHEIAETIFDYINHEADKAEMKRKKQNKLGYQEEEEQSDCILHGYIKRLGGTFTATWLTRYVRLYPNRLELWSESSPAKSPELIFMDQIEEVCNDYVQIKNESCIVIKLYNHSKYVFTNSDEIGLKEWHVSLKAAHKESLDMMTTMAEKATKIYGTEIPLKHMGKHRQQLQQEANNNSAIANLEQKIIQKELQASSSTTTKTRGPGDSKENQQPAVKRPATSSSTNTGASSSSGVSQRTPTSTASSNAAAKQSSGLVEHQQSVHKHHRGHHQHRSHHGSRHHQHHHHEHSGAGSQSGAPNSSHHHHHHHHHHHKHHAAAIKAENPARSLSSSMAGTAAATAADSKIVISNEPTDVPEVAAVQQQETTKVVEQPSQTSDSPAVEANQVAGPEQETKHEASLTIEASTLEVQQTISEKSSINEPEPIKTTEPEKKAAPSSRKKLDETAIHNNSSNSLDLSSESSAGSEQSSSSSISGDQSESSESCSSQSELDSLIKRANQMSLKEAAKDSAKANLESEEKKNEGAEQQMTEQIPEKQEPIEVVEKIQLVVSLENVSEQQEVLRDPSKRITSDNKQREQDLVDQYEKFLIIACTSSVED